MSIARRPLMKRSGLEEERVAKHALVNWHVAAALIHGQYAFLATTRRLA